jgi:3-isopropylmalate/(R)-2-methylmalate dehydratase large subunit
VKVIIEGNPRQSYSAKDLVLMILGILKTDKILGRVVEFQGEAIEKLNLAERITVLSMVTEMGGIIGFIPFNRKTVREIEFFSGIKTCPDEIIADEDAVYADVIRIDVSNIEPMVAEPPVPHHVNKISKIERIKVDFGFIGSCTNGRLEDLESAWRVLKGKKIAQGVRLAVVPATQKVYREALEKGIIRDLFRAGAIIANPGCGGCAQGHIGMTGKNEVMVSTGNRNFPGKQGDGLNYLVSPEVVAHSVLEGIITAGR